MHCFRNDKCRQLKVFSFFGGWGGGAEGRGRIRNGVKGMLSNYDCHNVSYKIRTVKKSIIKLPHHV